MNLFVKFFAWLAGIDLNNILGSVARIYEKKADTALGKEKVAAEVAGELIKGDIEHVKAKKELGLAAMTHPIWWVAWGLFVFPVGFYHAGIFFLSILSIGPQTYAILQVPPEQEKWAREIVMHIFTLQAGAGIAGAIIGKFMKR